MCLGVFIKIYIAVSNECLRMYRGCLGRYRAQKMSSYSATHLIAEEAGRPDNGSAVIKTPLVIALLLT